MHLSGMVDRSWCALSQGTFLRTHARTLAVAVVFASLGAAGCAVTGDIDGTKIYLGGDERVLIRGAGQMRQRELDRYECVGEMTLMCSVHGAVAECKCAGPAFGSWGL
jgi:hypothetical protein